MKRAKLAKLCERCDDKDTGKPKLHINTRDYFDIIVDDNGDKCGVCKLCSDHIKMKNSNTTGTRRHMIYKHPDELLLSSRSSESEYLLEHIAKRRDKLQDFSHKKSEHVDTTVMRAQESGQEWDNSENSCEEMVPEISIGNSYHHADIDSEQSWYSSPHIQQKGRKDDVYQRMPPATEYTTLPPPEQITKRLLHETKCEEDPEEMIVIPNIEMVKVEIEDSESGPYGYGSNVPDPYSVSPIQSAPLTTPYITEKEPTTSKSAQNYSTVPPLKRTKLNGPESSETTVLHNTTSTQQNLQELVTVVKDLTKVVDSYQSNMTQIVENQVQQTEAMKSIAEYLRIIAENHKT